MRIFKLDLKLDQLLSLSAHIDSDQFFYIISAFRLLTLILPSKNRRKLHFLLRFLFKLKSMPNSAGNLLSDLKSSTGKSSTVTSVNSERLRTGTTKSSSNNNEPFELFLLKSFLGSIIAIHDEDEEDTSELKTKLGLKLAQIFVNNYSEIMAIPQDLMASVKQRLSLARDKWTGADGSEDKLPSKAFSSDSNYSNIEGI